MMHYDHSQQAGAASTICNLKQRVSLFSQASKVNPLASVTTNSNLLKVTQMEDSGISVSAGESSEHGHFEVAFNVNQVFLMLLSTMHTRSWECSRNLMHLDGNNVRYDRKRVQRQTTMRVKWFSRRLLLTVKWMVNDPMSIGKIP